MAQQAREELQRNLREELARRRQQLLELEGELAGAVTATLQVEAAAAQEEARLPALRDAIEALPLAPGMGVAKELEAKIARKEAERAELEGRAPTGGGGGRSGEGGGTPRAVLIRRVNELVGNVYKQDSEIEKVQRESQGVRREINTLSETVGRSFALAEGCLFEAARRHPEAREAYKALVVMHEGVAEVAQWQRERGASAAALARVEGQ